MKRLNVSVLDIGTRFLAANAHTELCESAKLSDPRLAEAVKEMRLLWQTADSLVRGARDGLYEFLGATYEHASAALDPQGLASLQSAVREQYPSDKQKKSVTKMDVEALLLVAAMGVEQASLRSKYLKLLRKAKKESVPTERRAFSDWLKRSGGVVKALCPTAEALERTASSTMPRGTFQSLSASLLAGLGNKPTEKRQLTQTKDGFTVVLFYTDPRTKQVYRLAELTDDGIVDRAVRLAQEPVEAALTGKVAA